MAADIVRPQSRKGSLLAVELMPDSENAAASNTAIQQQEQDHGRREAAPTPPPTKLHGRPPKTQPLSAKKTSSMVSLPLATAMDGREERWETVVFVASLALYRTHPSP